MLIHIILVLALIGGVIMGAGFIIGVISPGTGICALSIGKIDAFVFLGGLTGAFLFAETYPLIEPLAMGGFKGPVKVDDWLSALPGVFTLILILAAAFLFSSTNWRRKSLADQRLHRRFRQEIDNDFKKE